MGRAWGWALIAICGCSKASSGVATVEPAAKPPEIPVSALPVTPANDPAVVAARREATAKNYADVLPIQRELGVRQCIARGGACNPADVDGIEDSAKTPKEKTHLQDIANAAILQFEAAQGVDGEEMSAAVLTAGNALNGSGSALPLSLIPTTTYGAAMKDPTAERGKVINASGNVIEIRADRSTAVTMYIGAIATGSGSIIRFVCPFPTDGILEGTWARFRGTLVQEYDYPNVAGGQTKSLLLVGSFNP